MADLNKIYTDLLKGKQYIRKVDTAKVYELILENDAMPADLSTDRPQAPAPVINRRGRLPGVKNRTPEQRAAAAAAAKAKRDEEKAARKALRRQDTLARAAATELENKKKKQELYDLTIEKALIEAGLQDVEVKGIDLMNPHIDPADQKVWNALYKVTPSKEGSESTEGGTKGSGNGEMALYYFLKKKGYEVKDTRTSSLPDLTVYTPEGDLGLEIKAEYEKKEIDIGRWRGRDQTMQRLINDILKTGDIIKSSNSPITFSERKSGLTLQTANPDNFTTHTLVEAFEHILSYVKEAEKYDQGDEEEQVFESKIERAVKGSIDFIFKELKVDKNNTTAALCAKHTWAKIVEYKMSVKPGDGGMIANVNRDGSHIEWYKINLNTIKDKILSSEFYNIIVSGSALKVPKKLLES